MTDPLPGLDDPATALLYLYMTLAAIDGEVEREELAAAGARLNAWGVTDPQAIGQAFRQVKSYQSFDGLGASLGHACGLLREQLDDGVRIQVVKDLMLLSAADGQAIEGEATLCNVVRRQLGVSLEAVTGP